MVEGKALAAGPAKPGFEFLPKEITVTVIKRGSSAQHIVGTQQMLMSFISFPLFKAHFRVYGNILLGIFTNCGICRSKFQISAH